MFKIKIDGRFEDVLDELIDWLSGEIGYNLDLFNQAGAILSQEARTNLENWLSDIGGTHSINTYLKAVKKNYFSVPQ